MWEGGWPLWPLSLASDQDNPAQLSDGEAGGSDISTAINSLLPALSQVFAVILVGYASVKLNVVNTGHKQGLSLFVTRLALPALLFSGMASLNFSKVDWTFLLAVAIGKAVMFSIAMGVTILLDLGKPHVLGTAGVHAIFVSQSNDFALGLPIFLPIFGKLHPDYISYLYLVAPISLVILNPIAFLFMEQSRGMDEDQLEVQATVDLTCCEDVPEGDESSFGVGLGPEMVREQRDEIRGYEPPQPTEAVDATAGAGRGGSEAEKGPGKDHSLVGFRPVAVLGQSLSKKTASALPESPAGIGPAQSRGRAADSLQPSPRKGNGERERSLLEAMPVDNGDILPETAHLGAPQVGLGGIRRVRVREPEGREPPGVAVEGRAGEAKPALSTVPETWNRRTFTGRAKPAAEEEDASKQKAGVEIWKVVYSVISTPVVFMVPVGLVANLIFNHNVPIYLAGPFATFGAAFAPLALFILGMSIADQTESTGVEETALGPLVVALTLIAAKCLLLPLIITLVLINFNAPTSLVMAGLVYGALPVAPATFFFACEYGLCAAWVGMATVLGTFLFGPLVYVIAQLAFVLMNDYEAFAVQVVESAETLSVIGAVGALWTLIAILRPRKGEGPDEFKEHRRMEKGFVSCIGLSWLVCCLANLTCGLPLSATWRIVRYFVLSGGDVAARIFTTMLAVSELLCCTPMGPSMVHSKLGRILSGGWLGAAAATAIPVLLKGGAPKQDGDLMTCWFPYNAPQFCSFGVVNCICITLITFTICVLIRDQFKGARLAGHSLLWSDVRLTWRPPQLQDAPDMARLQDPPSVAATPPALSPRVSPWPRYHSHFDSIGRRDGWGMPPGEPAGRFGDIGLGRPWNWSQPPSRQSSVRSRLSIRDPPRGLLEGAKSYASRAGGAEALLGLGSRTAWMEPSSVSRRWKQRTDIDEQNGMLLFCGYGVMAMLVSITMSVMALWNKGSWAKETAQGGLLLLLNAVLGFGQGAVLFLAYGLHPGLVEPLVSLREWWVEQRESLLAEEEDPEERPKWTDVFAGEVDDCGPRYEKVWRRLGSNVCNGNAVQDEWDRLPDDESTLDDSFLSRDIGEERVQVVTEDNLFETMPPAARGNR